MSLEKVAFTISIIALVVVVLLVLWLRRKIGTIAKSIKVEKITLPGYEVKVVNGELSFTPTK